MNQQELLSKWNDLKGNVQNFFDKRRNHQEDAEVVTMEASDEVEGYEDDLPLTLSHDEGPGVTYNYTENSEFSLGKPKAPAKGIDKFN